MSQHHFPYDFQKRRCRGRDVQFAQTALRTRSNHVAQQFQLHLGVDDCCNPFPFPNTVVDGHFRNYFLGIAGSTAATKLDLVVDGRKYKAIDAIRMSLKLATGGGGILLIPKVWVYFSTAALVDVYGVQQYINGVLGRGDFPVGSTFSQTFSDFKVEVPQGP